MSKYIPEDKLIAEIERLEHENCMNGGEHFCMRRAIRLGKLRNIITPLYHEQQEVDLEKFTEKINTFQARYKHPEIVSIKGAMAFMARMFYQYPNVARQWYEQLPKATMD